MVARGLGLIGQFFSIFRVFVKDVSRNHSVLVLLRYQVQFNIGERIYHD